jgi:hypothetical protein
MRVWTLTYIFLPYIKAPLLFDSACQEGGE